MNAERRKERKERKEWKEGSPTGDDRNERHDTSRAERHERDDVGADPRIRPRRTAMPGNDGDDPDDRYSDNIPQRTATPSGKVERKIERLAASAA